MQLTSAPSTPLPYVFKSCIKSNPPPIKATSLSLSLFETQKYKTFLWFSEGFF